jgi:CheY-like chemotaxis protein
MEHSHPTVLLVEDDPLLAMDVEAVLRGAGYEVLGPAGSAADALSILREETPDVAILVSISAARRRLRCSTIWTAAAGHSLY